MPLTAGVLIIGSLFWDQEKDRPVWRAERLNMAAARWVSAPIRYGRKSITRGGGYTMVLSGSCPAGQVRLVPCTRPVATSHDLTAEAEHLWKAEQPDAGARRIASSGGWGCVALLPNPARHLPEEVLEGWTARVAQEPEYARVARAIEEGGLLSEKGLLRIEWPRAIGEGGARVDTDLLLVTVTKPTLVGTPLAYPTVEAIAGAWNAAGKHVEYFWSNRDNGIETFQDDAIRALLRLRERGPA